MDDNKSKALAAALSQIEKQFGKGSIMRMGDTDIAIAATATARNGTTTERTQFILVCTVKPQYHLRHIVPPTRTIVLN